MCEYYCFIVTLLVEGERELIDCAVKSRRDALPPACVEQWHEPENSEAIRALLPQHVAEIGPIVHVEQIYEVIVCDKEG
jgi:hypothetical protein